MPRTEIRFVQNDVQDDHRQHDLDWFSLNGLQSDVPEAQNLTRINVSNNSFLLRDSITGGGYKIIYGYHVGGGNILRARMWYYSGSEASWRAFTGYREPVIDNGYFGCAWMKGAEHSDNWRSSGYVFECMVCGELEDRLEVFFNQDPNGRNSVMSHPVGFPKPVAVYPGPLPAIVDPSTRLASYYIYGYIRGAGQNGNSYPECTIAAEYAQEVNYQTLVLPPIVDPQAQRSINENIGSVEMQKKYSSMPIVGQGYKQRREGPGHQIKHERDLWNWLLPNDLGNRESTVNRHHPVLNLDYTIDRYRIAGFNNQAQTIILEIAYTGQVNHDYLSPLGERKTINTPICWVRSVFLQLSPLTSFGTYRDCPINLAFVVQKPIDYETQTSFYHAQKSAIETGMKKEGNYGLAKFNSRNQFTQNGVYSQKYIRLSLYNEAISPIIKAFKDYKNFPRFRNKYMFKLDDNASFQIIQNSIVAGINEYRGIQEGTNPQNYNTKGSHGDKGMQRANQLSAEINNCATTREISTKLHQCFKLNRIGNFQGGFLSKIRTNPTSLFTCVCRYLIALLLEQAPQGGPNNWNQRGKPSSNIAGPEYTLFRLDSYVSTLNPVGDIHQYITNKAPDILNQL